MSLHIAATLLIAFAVMALVWGWATGDDIALFVSIGVSAVAGVLLVIVVWKGRRGGSGL